MASTWPEPPQIRAVTGLNVQHRVVSQCGSNRPVSVIFGSCGPAADGDIRRPAAVSQKWVRDKVPTMDSTEFHAMFDEAAIRGWDEDELRQLARMRSEESGVKRVT